MMLLSVLSSTAPFCKHTWVRYVTVARHFFQKRWFDATTAAAAAVVCYRGSNQNPINHCLGPGYPFSYRLFGGVDTH